VRTPQLAADLTDLSAAAPDLALLVQFGSTITGRQTRRSDLDVAALCEGPADLGELYLTLAPRFRSGRLDLVDLRRAGPLLAREVARTGRVLFERRPGAFVEFRALASRRYSDTAKLRAAQRRAIRVFLDRHGLT
jgi:predicted nucleotidyltransferase